MNRLIFEFQKKRRQDHHTYFWSDKIRVRDNGPSEGTVEGLRSSLVYENISCSASSHSDSVLGIIGRGGEYSGMMSGLWIILNGYVGDGAEMDLSFFGGDWPRLKTSLLIFENKRPRVLLFWLSSRNIPEPCPDLELEGP